MATLLEEFQSITEALKDAGIDYAVCGGWAMAIHGLPLATIDIDLLILSDDLERLWGLAREHNYDVEGLPRRFGAIEIRRISKVDSGSKTVYTIDFLLVTDALREIWAAREQITWAEGTTWVVSREELINLKKIAGRAQDLVDIERLEEDN